MKFITTIAFAAGAGAFALFDLEQERPLRHERSWWSRIPSKVEDTVDYITSGFDHALRSTNDDLQGQFSEFLFAGQGGEFDPDVAEAFDGDRPHHPHHPPGRRPRHPRHGRGHDLSNLTIYEIISKSEYSTKFAKYVDKFEGIVDTLNSTKANFTVFVPIDHHHKKGKTGLFEDEPSDEFVEAALKYTIGNGSFPLRRLLGTHTLPTLLKEDFLGGEPQRLRVGFSFFGGPGLHVNFVGKVVAANIIAKNGIIHAIDHVVLPPPFVGRELTLFPQVFSTLLLAYEKTDFVKFIHGVKTNGSTVFAPSNKAFERLGPRANAFLFNTETGLKYLKAILKYHIVANATLYSDALYQNAAGLERIVEGDGGADADVPRRHTHVDLPTLLGDTSVAVDVTRWGVFTRIRVNSYVPVTLQDAVAKNGVVHVIGRVLIPPHKHPKDGSEGQVDGEIEVEDLKERLAGYLDDGKKAPITEL